MEIITDHKWKNFKYGYDVPVKIMQDRFDYLSEDENTDGFIYYRRAWYHLSNFMRIDKNAPFPGEWNGYYSDSFFSGILLKVSEDGEQYQIATYIS